MKITEDELLDVDKFNDFIEKLKQEILLSIPAIVIAHIKNEHEYAKVMKDFYIKFPELSKERQLVGNFVNSIAAKNPAMEIVEVFDTAGKSALEVLNGKRTGV